MKYSIYILFTIISIIVIQSCEKDPVVPTSDPVLTELPKGYLKFNSTNSPLPEDLVDLNSIVVDQSNNIWIGTQSSALVLKYNLSSNKWTTFGVEHFRPDVWEIADLDIDDNNNVWAASVDGVYKFNGNTWELSLQDTSLHAFSRSSVIHADNLNQVWCVLNGDLYRHLDDTWQEMSGFDSLSVFQIQALESDKDGNLWIGCFNGLVKYNGTSFVQIDPPTDVESLNIFDIDAGATDTLWVGGISGLHYLVGDSWTTLKPHLIFGITTSIEKLITTTITTSDIGKVFGTWTAGLGFKTGENYTFFRGSEFGIDTNKFQINELEYDLNGNLWIATRFGELIVYNENEIVK
ncbi:MAG: hypothetical protein HRT71_18090 [Flavobacteriales bacterium]|nr:hypothetical protein [Flavobacteriales bacterium]